MRRQLQKLLVLVMILAMAMSGCGSNNAEESSQAETTAAAAGESDTAEESTEPETLEPVMQIDDLSEYVVLGQYMGVEAVKASDELTDAEIETAIQAGLESLAEPEQITEGVVADGDTVYIDFVGKLDGVAFEGGTGDYSLTIGSGSFIDGFEEGLIGVEVGSTVDLNLTFPDPYQNNPDLAGKAVVFTVTVHYIEGEEMIVPELTDELAIELEYENAEAMRADMVAYLQEQKTAEVESAYEAAVWQAVIDNAEIVEHPEIYDSYYNNFIQQYEYTAGQYGMTLEQYLTAVGGNTEEFYAVAEEYATACMEQELVCRAIVEKEGMTVTEEEYQQTLSEYYTTYSTVFADEAELEAYYGKERIESDILWGRVIEMVIEAGIPVDAPAEDATEAESPAAAE